MDRREALALGRGSLRAPGRWETNLARFIRKVGVSNLVAEFNEDPDPNLHITSHAVYEWVNGRIPRPPCAVRLVERSGGEISYEDIFRHSLQVRQLSALQPPSMPQQRLTGTSLQQFQRRRENR